MNTRLSMLIDFYRTAYDAHPSRARACWLRCVVRHLERQIPIEATV